MEESKKGGCDEKVSYWKLFSFADGLDVVLMVVGSLSAAANGIALPFNMVVFGELIDTFALADPNEVVRAVSKVVLKFVYIGIVIGVASLLQVSFWTITGERQAARIRALYLKNIMRQDIAFFDKETSSGEVIGRMSGDTILVQGALGEKVGKFIQFFSTFICGFIIAFVKGWLLSLVMLSCLPIIVIAGTAMTIIISKMAARGQIAYAEAGNVVEQTIGSMRTVVSYSGEKRAIEKYNKSLKIAYDSSVKQGLAMGLGLGVVDLVLFASYGLVVWYGAKLIIQKGYSGGTVINIISVIITSGMSLGQASPSLSAIAAGRAAAYKMFETIERKPEIDAYDTNGLVLKDIKGDIELKNVHFSYPARPDVPIFSGFSLLVPCGTTTA